MKDYLSASQVWLALAAIAIVSIASPATANDDEPSISQDRAAIMERKIREIGEEIVKLQGRLRDGQAIVSYYALITRDMKQFYSHFNLVVTDCVNRQSDYEQLKKQGNPFADADLRPALQRCHADRHDFETSSANFSRLVDHIAIDVDYVEQIVQKIGPNIHRDENELAAYQAEKSLSDDLKSFKNSYDKFNSQHPHTS